MEDADETIRQRFEAAIQKEVQDAPSLDLSILSAGYAVVISMEGTMGEIATFALFAAQSASNAVWLSQGTPHNQTELLREIFGNPFRPVAFSPSWRTDTALSLARGMYDSRDFGAMPILADALQDAGCDNADVLNHCRQPGEHVRGCWVIDLLTGRK